MSNRQLNLNTTDPELRRIMTSANEVMLKNSRLMITNLRLERESHDMTRQHLDALANTAEDKREIKRLKELLVQGDGDLHKYAQIMDRILEKIGAGNKWPASTTTSSGENPQLLPKMLTVLEFLSKNGPRPLTGNQEAGGGPTNVTAGNEYDFSSDVSTASAASLTEAAEVDVITVMEKGEGEGNGEGSSATQPGPMIKTEALGEASDIVANPPPAPPISSDESEPLEMGQIKAENIQGDEEEEGMSRLARIKMDPDLLGTMASSSTARGRERKRSGSALEAAEGLEAKVQRIQRRYIDETVDRNRSFPSSSRSTRPIKQENEGRNRPVREWLSRSPESSEQPNEGWRRNRDNSSSYHHRDHERQVRNYRGNNDNRHGKGNRGSKY